MWLVNILWQQLLFCLDIPSLTPCSCPLCHRPRIKETYLQPSFIALLYHHVVMDLGGVGISPLLSSHRFVEQPLLHAGGSHHPAVQPQPGMSPCRMQICRGVYGFQAKAFPDLQCWGVTVLPCLWIQRKNHKQTNSFSHWCAELPAQNSINKPNTQYYLGYRVVPETLHWIACVCSTVYVFYFWSFKKMLSSLCNLV